MTNEASTADVNVDDAQDAVDSGKEASMAHPQDSRPWRETFLRTRRETLHEH